MADPIPRSALTDFAFPAIPRADRGHLLAIQFQLAQSQWWSPGRLREVQWLQLLPLLAHAAAHSPYYRDLFAASGITPPTARDDALLARIPISTRSALQEAGERLHCAQVPSAHGKPGESRTSGSTGRPLSFRRTPAWGEIWSALAMREYFWQRRDFSRRLAAIRIFPNGGGPWPEGLSSAQWSSSIGALYATGPAFGLNVSATPEQQLEWLGRTRPDYLTSFPSNLRALIAHAREKGRDLPRVLEIRTVGEMLTEEDRALIGAAWKAPVTDMYTCEEVGYLALQCPDHPGYHVQSEHVLIEVLDEDGNPCSPGQVGRVVLTDLHNFATPFIRYEIGDMAEVGEPCPCGRGLPRIRRILGRVRNLIRLPDGTKAYPKLGERRIAETPGADIRQYRVIQRSLAGLEVQVVSPRPLDEAQRRHIAEGLRESLGHPFEVTFTFPESIPVGANGKLEVFLSEVP
jgi:phenylacetate-CoA ligase